MRNPVVFTASSYPVTTAIPPQAQDRWKLLACVSSAIPRMLYFRFKFFTSLSIADLTMAISSKCFFLNSIPSRITSSVLDFNPTQTRFSSRRKMFVFGASRLVGSIPSSAFYGIFPTTPNSHKTANSTTAAVTARDCTTTYNNFSNEL